MLELNPKSIDNVLIFPDSADPFLYYYLPEVPQLGQIQLVKYRGETMRGGLLNLEVHLRLPEARLQNVRRSLTKESKLTPVSAIEGTVSLIVFDREHPPRRPALFGDHQATFAVGLNPQEVLLLEQALLAARITPLGVVYSLDYLALRPSYRFRLQANWERVRQRLEEKFRVNAIFLQVEVEKVVEELVAEGAITVELDAFTTEGIEDRDRFLQDIKSMVLSTFFTPQLEPIASTENNSFSFLLGFRYQRISFKQLDRRFLNLNVSEQTTVRRRIYPQGNLILTNINPQQLVAILDLDDPFFQTRHVEVISRADFETDGIAEIAVTLQYGDRIHTVLLVGSDAREQVSWNLEPTRDVQVRYRVRFKTAEADVESPEITTQSDFFEVVPRQLYHLVSIPMLVASNMLWEQYDSVRVRTRYRDRERMFEFNQNYREHTWNLLVRDSPSVRFQYQLRYQAVMGEDFLTPWLEAENEIFIRHPFPQQRTLQLIPLIDWSQMQTVEAEVTYQDPHFGIYQQQRFRFLEGNDKPQLFRANIRHPNHRLVCYRISFFDKMGNLQIIPESSTLEKRLFLRSQMQGHRAIEVSPAAVSFTGELEAITVQTRFADAANALLDVASFDFTSSQELAYFQFDFADEQHQSYEYRIVYKYRNGMQGIVEWQTSDRDLLVLTTRTLRSFLVKSITISTEHLQWFRFQSIVVQLQYENQEKELEFRADGDAVRWLELEFSTTENQEYRWRAIAHLQERQFGDRGTIYFPDENSWEATNTTQIFLDEYFPSNKELAIANHLFIVIVSTQTIDWKLVEDIKVRIEYGNTEKTFRLDADENPETLFLTPKISETDTYRWQAIFDLRDRDKLYYPSDRNWETSDRQRLELQDYLQILRSSQTKD
jgi:hypothetical protein